ncbi:MAG TPA: hemolysin III family protein [Longimicrobiales bacterium]|nr:hemolysin III family protein [Longimicrobiales bacterium]
MSGFFSVQEERFHSVTHGAGAVLAMVGAAWLLMGAVRSGDPWRIVSMAIYGLTLVGLYTASTLYHGVRVERLKARLRVVDHAAIYLFIAGSYTPFLLLPLRGAVGWFLFGLTWALAVGGVVYKLTLLDRFPRLSTVLYLGMGWLALVAVVPLVQRLSPATLAWMVAGGVVYSAGTLVYHMSARYAHVAWHLFVLVGSVCHFVAISHL